MANNLKMIKIGDISVDQKFNLPSTLSKKYCTFGYGNKYFMPMGQQKRAYEIPAPGNYDVTTNDYKGKSFGRQHRFLHHKDSLPKPGPGRLQLLYQYIILQFSYNISTSPGNKSKSFSLYQRLPEEKKILQSPSPNQYKIKEVRPTRFRAISFGHGNKTDFSKVTTNAPGPNAYHIPSNFDKYRLK